MSQQLAVEANIKAEMAHSKIDNHTAESARNMRLLHQKIDNINNRIDEKFEKLTYQINRKIFQLLIACCSALATSCGFLLFGSGIVA